jgi:hypothetical protein
MNYPVTVSSIEHRPVWRLRRDPNNARTHSDLQIRQIGNSIQEFGFVNPILIAPDDTIIAGHARFEAAICIAMDAVPVIVLQHLSETQRRALVIADNQLALNAGWNDDLLRAELEDLQAEKFDLDVIGFDEKELNRLVIEQDRPIKRELRELTHTDNELTPPRVLVSQPGDQWILGPHRFLCGGESTTQALEFADTTCRQWQQLTGKAAVLGHNQRNFEAVAADRQSLAL